MDFLANTEELPLDELRKTLIRLEDTITFAFIERAQFKLNRKIYFPGEIPIPGGEHKSFLEYFLHEVEVVHDDLPDPVLPPLNWPVLLKDNDINLNKEIFQTYITEITPKICSEGDDMNYGTAATLDIEVLQALSRRIHYEAKYRDPRNREKYIELIKNKDRQGIMTLLTDAAVEEKLLKRLRRKAEIYGRDVIDGESDQKPSNFKIGVDLVANTYRDFVIPLTKEVEVLYLLGRLDS